MSTEQETSENESTAINNIEQRANVYRVYIDGSCIRNGASTAQAGYGLYWGDQHPWNCSNPLPQDGTATATNNKAELAAAIKALHIARDHKLEQLIIYSDSNYVIQGITEWVNKWKENGWKTAGGEDVKNKEVWIELSKLSEASTTKITWKHVAAHSGISGNEEADKLAVQGAKQNTVKAQRSEGVKCNDAINPTIDKYTDSNTQPKVIYVQENDTNTNRQSTMKEHTTSIRKATRDRSNTPVPGSMNGSCASTQSSKSVAGNTKVKAGRSIENNESEGDSHTLKIMNNMETILETIVTELHQLREDQLEFKKEVKQQISGIIDKQQDDRISLSNLSKEVKDDIRICINKIEQLRVDSKKDHIVNNSYDQFTTVVSDFKKNVSSRLDSVSTTIQTLDTSMTSTRSEMNKMSRDCATEFRALDSKNAQIAESLVEMKTNIKRTGHTLVDIEKSLTSISEKDEFTRPARSAKETTCDVENAPVTDNKYTGLEDESDDEVIFNGADPGKKDCQPANKQESESTKVNNTIEKQNIISGEYKDSLRNNENKINSDKPKKRELVYLIGDSISGQVNPALLGKSTKTYVKKLKAPKIEDLHTLKDQIKDANMIIIHTGIKNLRGKESTDDIWKTFTESIKAFKEAAPESQIVVSKVIPVGDHEIDINRNLLNAQNEKTITELKQTQISFIDHGNLAERGTPIKEYYRPDLIHLAGQGVVVFAENLENEINRILKKGEHRLQFESETSQFMEHTDGRDINTYDNHNKRGERFHRPYQPTKYGNGQYGRQRYNTEERDQQRYTDRRYQRPMHLDNRRYTGYPSRSDNRDNERQYYRKKESDSMRYFDRKGYRDNDKHYYRSDYDKDNHEYDTQYTSKRRNYWSERCDESVDRYESEMYFSNDGDYYGRRRNVR